MEARLSWLVAEYLLLLNISRGFRRDYRKWQAALECDPTAQSPRWVESHQGLEEAADFWWERAMQIKKEIKGII